MTAQDTLTPCIVIVGGSFDPVHCAHVALAELFNTLLKPTQLRIIPAGWSWQKTAFHVSAPHRLAMLRLAFAELSQKTSLFIDEQEIKRAEQGIPSYTVDTLTQLRHELGASISLVFILGADQLQQLQHWKNWQHLWELTHLAVATRPGFALDAVDPFLSREFKQRSGTIEQLRNSPGGRTYLCTDLAIDISSTQIRGTNNPDKLSKLSLLPPNVLNYIQQHHLY